MKYMTKKNIEKVTNMIMEKGYDHITAENMAINCFCIAQQFGESVENCVRTIESTYKPMVVTQQKNRFKAEMEVKLMKNCKTCRKQNCEYRGKAYKNMTITCSQVCVAELKKECDTIATEEFRSIIESLKNGNYQLAAVKGILTQAECILNVADNIMAE